MVISAIGAGQILDALQITVERDAIPIDLLSSAGQSDKSVLWLDSPSAVNRDHGMLASHTLEYQ